MNMANLKTLQIKIEGISPYSQSRAIQSTKNTGESCDAFEQRTWRERMHVDCNGVVFLPPMCIKNCLSDCARYLSESVPGKGKATYTKHFDAGTLIAAPWSLTVGGKSVKPSEVDPERLFVPADGKAGSGKRVWKVFPLFQRWEASGEIVLLDPVLIEKPEKVREYLEYAGQFIGIGRFRPRNRGFYGRFKVVSFK